MKRIFPTLAALAFAFPAHAQEVRNCYTEDGDSFLTQISVLAEPWEENTRTFSNGSVRIALLDTWDPANYPMHLMLTYWPNDGIEAEGRLCFIVSDKEGYGFQNLTLTGMQADYDPAIGLLFEIPAQRYDADSESVADGVLSVTLNRASDVVTASYQ